MTAGPALVTLSRRVEWESVGGGPLSVVRVGGEIDQDTAPLVALALARALDAHASVCCDLSEVTFFGAAGAHALLAAHRRALETGRAFSLRGVHGVADRVMEALDPGQSIPR